MHYNRFFLPLALFAGLLPAAAGAAPSIVARVNLSEQRMNVYVDGVHQYSWPVSTARRGYVTPTGSYRPHSLVRMHYSRKYDNSPMPHSVFFRGGYAIHGTNEVGRLGRRASHGCIRLHPGNAAKLYNMIRTRGSSSARISITY